MPKNAEERYDSSLTKAEAALEEASSQLQRQVRAEMRSLDATIRKLRQRFAKRTEAASTQSEIEQRDIEASLAEVRASLAEARAHQAEVRKLRNATLDETAATLVRISEQQLESFPMAAESRIKLIQADERIRGQLRDWMNSFGDAAVSSVFDDVGPERAAALLSGLTIIGGVPGGPLAAGVVATAGSAVLLVADVLKRSSLRKRISLEDQTIARYEDALQLLSVARKIFEGWLRILG